MLDSNELLPRAEKESRRSELRRAAGAQLLKIGTSFEKVDTGGD